MSESRLSGPPAAGPVPSGLSAAEIYCSGFWGLETPGARGLGFWSSSRSAPLLKFQVYTAAFFQAAPLRTWPEAAWTRVPWKGCAARWSCMVPFRCPLVGRGAGPGLGGICRGDQCPHLLPHLPGPSPTPALLTAPGLLSVASRPVATVLSRPTFRSPRPVLCILLLLFRRGSHGDKTTSRIVYLAHSTPRSLPIAQL